MQRINNYLHVNKEKPYVLNLDPAVLSVPFQPNIDIRDSINYKEVMKQYNLGPNGGILTSLNLFATKIDQIISLLEKRANPGPDTSVKPPKHILVDTPGQIEVFVWSASGSILLESLASSFPTVIAYIIDTPRTHSTSTFMSNMLYACSILYKTKLPMILVFNKTDVQDAEFAKEWMTDFEAFQDALRAEENKGVFGGEGYGGGSGYMSSLLNSMSLMLEEFYKHLSMVGVSSMTGDGIDEFFEAVEEKRKEFERDYKPELEKRRKERQEESAQEKQRDLTKFMKDMQMDPNARSREQNNDDDEEAEAVDPDDYPDEEREDPEQSLKRRYESALQRGGAMDEDDPTVARILQGARRA
jgi:GPN-loop GTPase